MSRRIVLAAVVLALGLSAATAHAQIDILSGKGLRQPGGAPFVTERESPKFTVSAAILPAKGQEPARLSITADILPEWHIYSITQPVGGPLKTKINLQPSDDYRLVGPFQANPPPHKSTVADWPGVTVEEHTGQVIWQAPLELAPGVDPSNLIIRGEISAQACNKSCLLQSHAFTARLQNKPAAPAPTAPEESSAQNSAPQNLAQQSSTATVQAAGLQAPAAVATARQPEFHGEPTYVGGHASITGRLEPSTVLPGGSARLILTATPSKPYHVYALADRDTDIPGKGKPTLIDVQPAGELQFSGPKASDKPQSVASEVPGGGTDSYYTSPVSWTIDISVPKEAVTGEYPIDGLIGFHTCKPGHCDFPSAARFKTLLWVAKTPVATPAPLMFAPAKFGEVAALAVQRPPRLPEKFEVTHSGGEAAELPMMILFSLLGGLILNLMPCVLPVIGLKVLAFVEQAGHSRARIFLLNLWYTAGILVVFMVLATLAVTLNLGWGQQFGSTGFNIAMCGLVFAMALSFLGIWEIPIPGFVGSGTSAKMATREGAIGAFAKGIITTVLATPCSGPFLGSVFGFTLKQPPHITYVIFASIALGMASPYLLIGAFPRLVGFLPKPGAWMETFKQLMAFMLLGTVVFMFSFMDTDYLVPTFAMLIGIWLGCWWIGRTPWTVSTRRKMLSWLEGAAAAAVVASFAFTYLLPHKSILDWQPFSQPKLAELTAEGKTVMVDFTAKWCLNCHVNMKTAIDTEAVRKLVEANHVVPLLADWTDGSPEVKQMLELLGKDAIPVLAIFPAGKSERPIILDALITQGQLLDALQKAGPSQGNLAVAGPAAGDSAQRASQAAHRELSRN